MTSSMRHLALLLLLAIALSAGAQSISLPAWIHASFSPEAATFHTDEAAVSTLHNTYIGSYTVRITIRHDGITQQLYVSQWSDTTRGIVQVQMIPGFPHTTYFADLARNTAVIANIIDRTAYVGELNAVLLTDRMGSPGAGAEFAPFSTINTKRTADIADVACTEHLLVEGTDTMHLWLADLSPSPFAEAPVWIPLNEGPLKAFRLLYRLGDRVAFKFVLAPMIEMEVIAYSPGPMPPPHIDLSTFTVVNMALRSAPTAPPARNE
ncbi:MAG: hypothetical protein R2818_03860 [Flavobacteriales bacterium]